MSPYILLRPLQIQERMAQAITKPANIIIRPRSVNQNDEGSPIFSY
jgi:hypothetical protein